MNLTVIEQKMPEYLLTVKYEGSVPPDIGREIVNFTGQGIAKRDITPQMFADAMRAYSGVKFVEALRYDDGQVWEVGL